MPCMRVVCVCAQEQDEWEHEEGVLQTSHPTLGVPHTNIASANTPVALPGVCAVQQWTTHAGVS